MKPKNLRRHSSLANEAKTFANNLLLIYNEIMKNYYVYMMTNQNNTTLYIGVTNNIERRLTEHKNGLIDGFTKKYNLHKLVFLEECPSVTDAIAREKQLKGFSRNKKEALINETNPGWKDLSSYI